MKKYDVGIEGVTPYMQHRMDDVKLEEWERVRGRIIERDDVAREDNLRAQYVMYQDENGQPFMPSEHIRGALIDAGKLVKAKVGNANRNMANIVAGMFFVSPEQIRLPDDWVVDKRSAVNQNIKARVISIRPKWNKWTANFVLSIDNDTLTDATVKDILMKAGQYCGLGSFRPTKRGMFGRFNIVKFERISA